MTLTCREVAYQDYLGIEISKDEVKHTMQCEDVQSHMYQGCEGVGVGVSGVTAFWA